MRMHQNPATYMLEAMGNVAQTDFHDYYNKSVLCNTNLIHADELCGGDDEPTYDLYPAATDDEPLIAAEAGQAPLALSSPSPKEIKQQNKEAGADNFYVTSYWHQFVWVSRKVRTSYWRTPTYNFGRMMVSVLIALIFSSAYPSQTYYDPTGVVSRVGVIYITCMFLGVVAMQTILSVTADELVAYYREQQSNMYSPIIYSICTLTVEIPYVFVSSLLFVLPFFYFVGFQNVGDATVKFFYYWLFIGLYVFLLLSIGTFLVATTPSLQAAAVFAGITSTLFSVFAGFMINPFDIPSFWQFMYWLDPLHYALQGLVMTQFHGDTTVVS